MKTGYETQQATRRWPAKLRNKLDMNHITFNLKYTIGVYMTQDFKGRGK